jgi:hypothetical protein
MTVVERVNDAVEAGGRAALRLPAWAAPAGVAAAFLSAAAYIGAVNPHDAGHYPTCPSLWLTGYYCPGCGSLRATHDLVHGNLAGAWAMNPLFVIVVPWLAWRWIKWVLAATGHPVKTRPAPAWVLYAVFGVIIAYWIARNVPMLAPYLAP